MKLQRCYTIDALRNARARRQGVIGFVPTMGALHEGHRSLMRAAREQCDAVVASIFVNPMQFGQNEDLATYPRTLEADCRMLEEEGVELLFCPSVEEMYPAGAATYVDVGPLGERLDGASRPGHFRGVATVVLKLFNIVQPQIAYFGQKDAAQVAVLKTMVRDLNVPVEIAVCPTVREADGLARSSRNIYLQDEERSEALALSQSLQQVRQAYRAGSRNSMQLTRVLQESLQQEPNVRLDYATIVDPLTLLPVEEISQQALVAVAAWVGKTRLIDNLLLGQEQQA